ncbi:ABC-2 type transport system ATP-binding protein [Clostridium cavendishii DSM 21758]|uniref:ABC-2 type transport system ATP-binding protein n=1 Tax=Clostridium cavendishii DSM 21758 TaxID=1121302 RepID=A0A1M6HZB8_9CLOT|nr:ABC transporter ATP-binding protein [Clostridium cavendishii]SHJ27532.1 ABC-2 type transport system ATP-binding protein [Clostridium cavendishii DSM 21758]
MKNNILVQTKNLTKKYKNDVVLDSVNITIERGRIYALIGQNGAGKTSLIRILTGLSFKSAGEVELFSKSEIKDLEKQRQRIGSLIEGPTLYNSMTAYQNLEAERICRGVPNKENIDKVLKLVGLEDVKKKKVKNFSLGMKQRLGIAMALLSNPELLILDEPTNGLDPIGMVEIRELIKKLNEENGITIIISSHILSELYQVATNYIIINKGKVLEDLTLEELDEKCKKHISIKVDDVSKGATVIEERLNTTNFKIMNDGTIKLYDNLDDIKKVSFELSKAGLIITQISVEGDSLEEYFVQLIGGSQND